MKTNEIIRRMASIPLFLIFLLHTSKIQLSFANLDCTTEWTPATDATDDSTRWIQCKADHPTLVSCGCFPVSASDRNADGCYIDSSDNRCYAQAGSGGGAVKAVARCCKFPDEASVTCNHAYTPKASGDDNSEYSTCASEGFSGNMVGCGVRSDHRTYDGGWPGWLNEDELIDQQPQNTDFPVNGYFGTGRCNAQDGESDGETFAQMTCCDTGDYELDCKLRWARTETSDAVSVSCGSGYTVTSCSGVGRYRNLGYFVQSTMQMSM